MKVKWLGHACFAFTSEAGTKIVTDPYTTGAFGLNYGPVEEQADIVTVSHDHADHNNVSTVKGNPKVLKGGGSHSSQGVEFHGIDCYHDNSSGRERGPNTIFCFTLDGIRVCHLGDLGHALTEQNQADIGAVDLLLVPVGGNFTIDAKVAAETCGILDPRVVIPMHYRNERCPEFPVAGVDDFLALMQRVKRVDGSEAEFRTGTLPEATEVVVLKPTL
jgi:L-ascorbate metabolism protein UlaG (beta-lactamase superfamily)